MRAGSRLRFSAVELSLALMRSTRDDTVISVVRRAAELACERRPAWWRWAVWMAAGITLERCGIRRGV